MNKINYKSYSDLVRDIKENISKINNDYELVVGIPRSGMIPAYIISSILNIDCIDLDSFIENKKLQKGETRKTRFDIEKAHNAKKVLLVDDSLYSGNSIKNVLNKIPKELKTKINVCIIYSSSKKNQYIDNYLVFLEAPKIFEWNIFNNSLICISFIDIKCFLGFKNHAVTAKDFIGNKTVISTNYMVDTIVNHLLSESEAIDWLNSNNIKYKNLITLEKGHNKDVQIKNISNVFKNSEAKLYMVAQLNDAMQINSISAKSVYCVSENKIINPNSLDILTKRPSSGTKSFILKIKHRVKMILNK